LNCQSELSSILTEAKADALVDIFKEDIEEQMTLLNAQKKYKKTNGYQRPHLVSCWPFCICSAEGRFRKTVLAVVHSCFFENFILLTIIANCFSMAIQTTNSKENFWLKLELAFQIIYTVEVILKILAFGFVFEKNSYLRDWWNILDFTVVCGSWLSMGSDTVNISAMRGVRALRTLRTLNAFPEMANLV